MPDTAALAAIVERLEGGEAGPDVDLATFSALGGLRAYWCEYPDKTRVMKSHVSTSLDAVAEMQEQLLPGWPSSAATPWRGRPALAWVAADRDLLQTFDAAAPTEPAARLAAILKAVIAREGQDG